jgi:hypothetical protein
MDVHSVHLSVRLSVCLFVHTYVHPPPDFALQMGGRADGMNVHM